MSYLIGEIVANVRADSGQFRREMRNVETQGARSSQRTQRSLGGIGTKLTSIAFIAKGVFASSLVMGARAAVKEFALLEGAMAKFDVVFGEQAREMEAWVNQFREGVPLARREIIQAAGSMQDLLIPMGVAREEASQMTREWLELAAALAAFNDVPVDRALDAIRSGIAGQSRPLRELGIDARETALQQTALAQGLMSAGDQMTDQVRQQALLIRAYEQSKDAVDGYQDQLGSTLMIEQELGAQWKDTLAVIGEGLQPAYNELLKTLIQMVTITQRLSTAQTGFMDIIRLQTRALGINIGALKDGVVGLINFADATTGARKASRDFYKELERGLSGDLNSDELSRLASNLSSELENISKLAISMGIDPEDFMPFQELMGNAHALGAILEQTLKKGVEGSEEISDSVKRLRVRIENLPPVDNIFDPSIIKDSADGIRDINEIIEEMERTDFTIDQLFQVGSIGRIREELQGLEEQLVRTTDPERARSLQAEIDELNKKIMEMRHGTEGLGDTLEDSTGAARFFSTTLADGLDQVLFRARSLEDALQNILRQLASRALTTLLMGAFTGGFGGSFFGAMFGRQSGGPVTGGSPYMVGEQGPELFLPQTSGKIMPNHQLSGGSISPAQMERAFLNALDKKLEALPPRAVYAMSQKGRLDY